MKKNEWNEHYSKDKSLLLYPDENLVRLVSHELKRYSPEQHIRAIDIGCGSGRHVHLLNKYDINSVIASDYSFNALNVCRDTGVDNTVNCDNRYLPFKNSLFDIAVAWGSLHYSEKDQITVMLDEIKRVMKQNGVLFTTLRRDNDTYLKRGSHLGGDTWITDLADLHGATVSFFSEDEIISIFKSFNEFRYGWMARSIVGNPDKIVSHWIISARK